MTKTKDGLMFFNNFLSTSKDRNVSLHFAEVNQSNPDLIGILFVMTIDPAKSTTPFASIVDFSCYDVTENEVLFSMNTVFRIGEIKSMDENHRLFRVDLTLTSDNDKDLRLLTDHIREETFPQHQGWLRLGLLLHKMGQSAKAQQPYEILLEQTTDEREKGRIYERLGAIKYEQGEYEETLEFYEKALEIQQQILPPSHPDLAYSYNNIGNVYYSLSDYSKALSSYEKALEIMQQSPPLNHSDLASTYNNIGAVYYDMGDYPKARSSYEKALEIRQQSSPPNHPDLGMSYYNIGLVYEKMGNYSRARSFYERAVDIGQHSLVSNHPHLQTYKKNLDDVKKKL
jgi:tetratricopeptide (TPR) repeat protein